MVLVSCWLSSSPARPLDFWAIFVGGLKAIAPPPSLRSGGKRPVSTAEGAKEQYEDSHLALSSGNLLGCPGRGSGQLFFPISIELASSSQKVSPPDGIGQVLSNLLLQLVDNPVNALITANYIGIPSRLSSLELPCGKPVTTARNCCRPWQISLKIVEWIINLAPLGILGLVYTTISGKLPGSKSYGVLLLALIASMLIVALIINPLIGHHAAEKSLSLGLALLASQWCDCFFTRSSAANIPVNMKLCRDLGLNPETYSVSIPSWGHYQYGRGCHYYQSPDLGCCHTLGIRADFGTALVLSIVAAISACGASGVAGGSLLLIPVACSLFEFPMIWPCR